jgi:hypothetical protein
MNSTEVSSLAAHNTISPREGAHLFHHVSRYQAYQLYLSLVRTHATSMSEAYKLIKDQFCSAASQHSTKTLLDTLYFFSISMEKNLSKKESIYYVYKTIARLSSKFPPVLPLGSMSRNSYFGDSSCAFCE